MIQKKETPRSGGAENAHGSERDGVSDFKQWLVENQANLMLGADIALLAIAVALLLRGAVA